MKVLVCTILTGAMLAATYTAVTWQQTEAHAERSLFTTAQSARRALEREVRIRAATKDATLNHHGWPESINPAWFGSQPPLNPYIIGNHPWLEIAGNEQADYIDPPIRQALTPDVAAFWYNPANGILRARVGPAVTDAQAIDLYNRLNSSSIDTLFASNLVIVDPPSPLTDQASDAPRIRIVRSRGR